MHQLLINLCSRVDRQQKRRNREGVIFLPRHLISAIARIPQSFQAMERIREVNLVFTMNTSKQQSLYIEEETVV